MENSGYKFGWKDVEKDLADGKHPDDIRKCLDLAAKNQMKELVPRIIAQARDGKGTCKGDGAVKVQLSEVADNDFIKMRFISPGGRRCPPSKPHLCHFLEDHIVFIERPELPGAVCLVAANPLFGLFMMPTSVPVSCDSVRNRVDIG
jgi:hypothetical protein